VPSPATIRAAPRRQVSLTLRDRSVVRVALGETERNHQFDNGLRTEARMGQHARKSGGSAKASALRQSAASVVLTGAARQDATTGVQNCSPRWHIINIRAIRRRAACAWPRASQGTLLANRRSCQGCSAVRKMIERYDGGVAQPGQSSGFISRVSLVQIQSPLIDTTRLPNAS
jgi:hypothetical protein